MKYQNKSIQSKKVFQEKNCDEICNFNPKSLNQIEGPETGTRENTFDLNSNNYNSFVKEKGFNRSKNNNRSSSKDREKNRKPSRQSSKNSFKDSNTEIAFQSPLLELVDSLKEKINFYENEVKMLIEEKIQMQMTINNMQIQQMKSNNSCISKSRENNTKRKSQDSENKILKISHESIFEINNQSNLEKFNKNNISSLNNSHKSRAYAPHNASENICNNNNQALIIDHQNNLERQKIILEENKSFLEDTINTHNLNVFGNENKIIFLF